MGLGLDLNINQDLTPLIEKYAKVGDSTRRLHMSNIYTDSNSICRPSSLYRNLIRSLIHTQSFLYTTLLLEAVKPNKTYLLSAPCQH